MVTPESFPFVYSIFFLAAVIVGGMGSILGLILGAVFMTTVPEVLKLGVGVMSPLPSSDARGAAVAGPHHRSWRSDHRLPDLRAARAR